ncbi:uncharacterized protein ACA1_056310, partial [Acanthamoeba castellanii str. Neff]
QKISENGVNTLLMKFVKVSQQQHHGGQNDETITASEQGESDQPQAAGRSDTGGASRGQSRRIQGELPINQATLLGTLFLFCHVCLEVAQLRGAKITEEEKESYWHLWRYIGYMLGIDDQVMPQKYDDGLSARLGAIYRERQQPDYTSKLLTTSTVDAMADLPSIPFNRPLFNVSIRKFLGEPLSNALGIGLLSNSGRTGRLWRSGGCRSTATCCATRSTSSSRPSSSCRTTSSGASWTRSTRSTSPFTSLLLRSCPTPLLLHLLLLHLFPLHRHQTCPQHFCPFLSGSSSGSTQKATTLVRCPFGG